MITFQQSQTLTSHFESFWSIVKAYFETQTLLICLLFCCNANVLTDSFNTIALFYGTFCVFLKEKISEKRLHSY